MKTLTSFVFLRYDRTVQYRTIWTFEEAEEKA
jgi:hypothetical protein